jgi:hypothetical protein
MSKRRYVAVAGMLAVALSAVGCAASDDSASDATTTTAPPLPDGACVARMSDPNPGQGGSETVIVDSHFASVPVQVVAHYKSKDSTFSGSVNARKHAEVTFSIGQPTAEFPVNVDVAVGNAADPAAGEKCASSFTPH